MHVGFHFTVTDLPLGSVSCLYRGGKPERALPEPESPAPARGLGRRRLMPGSVVPVTRRFRTHQRGQKMAIARIATCVALATSGTTSALKRIDGTRTMDAVPTKLPGLGPVITRPPQKKRCAGGRW